MWWWRKKARNQKLLSQLADMQEACERKKVFLPSGILLDFAGAEECRMSMTKHIVNVMFMYFCNKANEEVVSWKKIQTIIKKLLTKGSYTKAIKLWSFERNCMRLNMQGECVSLRAVRTTTAHTTSYCDREERIHFFKCFHKSFHCRKNGSFYCCKVSLWMFEWI